MFFFNSNDIFYLSDVLNVSEDVIYSNKKQHSKYKIISCSNYKSRKQNSKTIWLNKSNKICFKEKFSMYTQTLYELSQEAERLLQLSRQQLQLLEKIPLCTRRRCATTGFTLESA